MKPLTFLIPASEITGDEHSLRIRRPDGEVGFPCAIALRPMGAEVFVEASNGSLD